MVENEFTFELKGFKTDTETNAETDTETFTGKNNVDKDDTSTGTATLSVPTGYFKPENATKVKKNDARIVYTYTFYATEADTNDLTITYDKTKYLVTVTVTETTVTQTIGTDVVTSTNREIGDPVIQIAGKDENGDLTWTNVQNGIAFVNKYEKPEEPPKEDPKEEKVFVSPELKLSLEKVFEITGEFAATGTFDFEVYTEENGTKASQTNDVKINIADLVADSNHTQSADFSFDFIGNKEFDGNSFTFYVSEKKGDVNGVTYSDKKYQVTVPVTSTSVTEIISGVMTTITTYKYGDASVKIANGTDADGNTIWGDVTDKKITFTNVFKPTTPPTDTDSENPGPDPEEPTTPPTTPDRPSRPTPPPTPEEPTIDIPDDDVPLAPAPEEPEVSIPDEDVPLAGEPPLVELPEPEVPLAPMPPETTTIPDPEVPLAGVPQTGDNAGGFYALMALAACGLVVLNLRKKENEI